MLEFFLVLYLKNSVLHILEKISKTFLRWYTLILHSLAILIDFYQKKRNLKKTFTKIELINAIFLEIRHIVMKEHFYEVKNNFSCLFQFITCLLFE